MYPSANPGPEQFPATGQPMILGFDPGRQKCGLAVMGLDRKIHYHQVVPAAQVATIIQELRQVFPISLLVMGDQTTASEWQAKLQHLPQSLRVILVDERYSSLAARERYWQMYPPKGLYRLVPPGMRTAPRQIDDIVAIVLIERYLERLVGSMS